MKLRSEKMLRDLVMCHCAKPRGIEKTFSSSRTEGVKLIDFSVSQSACGRQHRKVFPARTSVDCKARIQ